jgi:hypothetical protein
MGMNSKQNMQIGVQKGTKRGPYEKCLFTHEQMAIIRNNCHALTPDEMSALEQFENVAAAKIRSFMYREKIPVKYKTIHAKRPARKKAKTSPSPERSSFTNYSNKQW